jgi:hypothetical protein
MVAWWIHLQGTEYNHQRGWTVSFLCLSMRLISRGALFRGISPSLLRAAPAAASTFGAFELTRGEWSAKMLDQS